MRAQRPSAVVLISWWSNCLAWACLNSLDDAVRARDTYVVQVGKSPSQRAAFSRQLPAWVRELPYDPDAPAEHSKVVEHIALGELAEQDGVWFIDHDVIMHADLDPWLSLIEDDVTESNVCLCHAPGRHRAITQPAFWMSPSGWPHGMPPLDPVPFEALATARRPDMFPSDGRLVMPQKDTLVSASEALAAMGRMTTFRWPFPPHEHLGGLSLFASETVPPDDVWVSATIRRFNAFFQSCPSEWLAGEDVTLLQRVRKLEGLYGA